VALLHARGQRWVPIVDPGIKIDPGYPAYEAGLAAGIFITEAANKAPYTGQARPRRPPPRHRSKGRELVQPRAPHQPLGLGRCSMTARPVRCRRRGHGGWLKAHAVRCMSSSMQQTC